MTIKKLMSYYNPGGVIPGCEVLCCKNTYRKKGVFNGMICNVLDVNGGLIKIERNGVIIDDYFVFKNNFDFANAYTVFKAQGKTIDYHYNCC